MICHIADIINIPYQSTNIFRVILIGNQLSEISRKFILGYISQFCGWYYNVYWVTMDTVKLKAGNALYTKLHNLRQQPGEEVKVKIFCKWSKAGKKNFEIQQTLKFYNV